MNKQKSDNRNNEIKKWMGDVIARVNLTGSQSKKFKYAVGRKLYDLRFKEGSQCMYPGCVTKSVHSHTFQKSSILRSLSKNGKVYTPKFSEEKCGVVISTRGIDRDATFFGFCDKHEAIFKDFESKGYLEDEMDFLLQAYRCMCREIKMINDLILLNKELCREIRNQSIDNIRDSFVKDFDPDPDEKNLFEEFMSRVRFHLDDRMNMENDKLLMIKRKFEIMSKNILNATVRNNCKFSKVKNTYFWRKTLVGTLPICISGHGSFIKDKNTMNYGSYFLISFPNNGNQEILLFSSVPDSIYLDAIIDGIIADEDLINFIGRFALSQSDNWFISPYYYDDLSGERKEDFDSNLLSSFETHNLLEVQDVFKFSLSKVQTHPQPEGDGGDEGRA